MYICQDDDEHVISREHDELTLLLRSLSLGKLNTAVRQLFLEISASSSELSVLRAVQDEVAPLLRQFVLLAQVMHICGSLIRL